MTRPNAEPDERGLVDYREVITTMLDVLAVLAVAAGVAAGLFVVIGWWSVAVGGLVVFGAVRGYDALVRRRAGGDA